MDTGRLLEITRTMLSDPDAHYQDPDLQFELGGEWHTYADACFWTLCGDKNQASVELVTNVRRVVLDSDESDSDESDDWSDLE